jgi:hypothetical protein
MAPLACVDWASQKARTEVLVPWLTLLGVVFGGGLTLNEYRARQQEKRIEITFQFLERFTTAPISDAHSSIRAAWESEGDSLLDIFTRADLDQDQMIVAFSQGVRAMVGDKQLGAKIDEMLAFFEQLAVCVKHNLCDSPTAQELFQGPAREFFNQFYPHFCSVRRRWKDEEHAARLEAFVYPAQPSRQDACDPRVGS